MARLYTAHRNDMARALTSLFDNLLDIDGQNLFDFAYASDEWRIEVKESQGLSPAYKVLGAAGIVNTVAWALCQCFGRERDAGCCFVLAEQLREAAEGMERVEIARAQQLRFGSGYNLRS